MSFWLVHLHVRGFSLRLPHPLWVQPEPLAQSSHAHQLLPGTHTIRHASDWPGGHAGGLLQSSCTWQFVQLKKPGKMLALGRCSTTSVWRWSCFEGALAYGFSLQSCPGLKAPKRC